MPILKFIQDGYHCPKEHQRDHMVNTKTKGLLSIK